MHFAIAWFKPSILATTDVAFDRVNQAAGPIPATADADAMTSTSASIAEATSDRRRRR